MLAEVSYRINNWLIIQVTIKVTFIVDVASKPTKTQKMPGGLMKHTS